MNRQQQNHELELKFIQNNLASWKDVTSDQVTFQRLQGISNVVFKVTTKSSEITPNPIILRKFGKQCIVDRSKENYVIEKLSKLGQAPQIYGVNEDYRVEEYYDSRVIRPEEINKKHMRRKLAQVLGALHKIDFTDIDHTGFFHRHLNDMKFHDEFLKKCKSKDLFEDHELQYIEEIQILSSKDELEFIRSVLPTEDPVFCHNDLLNNNILVLNMNSNIRLIDYEYGNYSFRGFDIGNMYAESIMDYSVPTFPYYEINEKYYPTDEDLIDFSRYYLLFNKMDFVTKDDEEKALNDEEFFNKMENKIYDNDTDKQNIINDLLSQIKIGIMLSNYYWCAWAIIMSKNPDIDFDYIRFSKDKYQQYQKFKNILVKKLSV